MEPIHLNNIGTSIEEPMFEQIIQPSPPEISGIAGDPQVNPRVGGEYQATIPPMISESERSLLLLNPYDSEGVVDSSHAFLMGLPFPISWVRNRTDDREDKGCRMNNPENLFNANGLRKSRSSVKNNIVMKKGPKHNAEPLDLGMGDGQESKPPKVAVKANLPQLHKNEFYDLVPGSCNRPWSDAEVNSFILGLYIFGKSFFLIKSFMENKEMGDILCFYYGDFYASDGYHRWSDCQKKKRKKCIYGQKLFTGWRQQELLSRLHCHVPEHSQNALLEVSTAFSEGKVSLEDYVFNLKAIVGIQALVNAIGIGKGKEDLTSLAVEPGKNNPLFAGCPIGKACSSLTSGDIIKLLTGGFRLSKARCSDIFWEAVWPRLLARGWHSEQPKNQIYMGSNHCLVFLIPGVKKFSKRKLVKGNHYFDSVSDVLSKVASEPQLIELETEEARDSSCNEEDRWVEVPSDQDDLSIQQSHRYLKPRVSSSNLNLARFTIVDSGLVDGGKLSKMREMRYAPDGLKVKSLLTTLSSNIEMICLENSQNDNELEVVDSPTDGSKNINKVERCTKTFNDCGSNDIKFTIVDTSLTDVGKSSKVRELRLAPVGIKVASEITKSRKKNEGDSSMDSIGGNVPVARTKLSNGEKDAYKSDHSEDMIGGSSSEMKEVNRDIGDKLLESLQDIKNESIKNQSTRTIKHKFSRRPKSGNSNNLVPVVKRRRLTACGNTEISHVIENFSVGLGSKLEGSSCALKSTEDGSDALQINNTPEKLSLTTSLVEGRLEESAGSMLGAIFDREASYRTNVKYQTPSLIDLNLPQVPLRSEALTDVESSQGTNVKHTCFPSNSVKPDSEALSTSVDAVNAAEKPDTNPRRQSTRNRPLTTRALEALECGFLGSVKRQKSMQVHTQELPHSSSSHWPHFKVKVTSSHGKVGSVIVDAKEGDTTGTLNKKNLSTKLLTEQKKSF